MLSPTNVQLGASNHTSLCTQAMKGLCCPVEVPLPPTPTDSRRDGGKVA